MIIIMLHINVVFNINIYCKTNIGRIDIIKSINKKIYFVLVAMLIIVAGTALFEYNLYSRLEDSKDFPDKFAILLNTSIEKEASEKNITIRREFISEIDNPELLLKQNTEQEINALYIDYDIWGRPNKVGAYQIDKIYLYRSKTYVASYLPQRYCFLEVYMDVDESNIIYEVKDKDNIKFTMSMLLLCALMIEASLICFLRDTINKRDKK